jgi:integration host factor subunit beta
MTKSDLINALNNQYNTTKQEAVTIVNVCFKEMSAALASGDRVEIRGLGAFSVKKYKAYNGRNQKPTKSSRSNLRSSLFSNAGRN